MTRKLSRCSVHLKKIFIIIWISRAWSRKVRKSAILLVMVGKKLIDVLKHMVYAQKN